MRTCTGSNSPPFLSSTRQRNTKFEQNVPAESPVLIQSGFATLAMAKMSAARKRHPDITVSLSMSVRTGCGGGRMLTYGPSSRPVNRAGARRVEIIAIDSQQRRLALVSVAATHHLAARRPRGLTDSSPSAGMLACCCTFTKTLSKILACNLFLPRMPGIRRSPDFSCSGFLFSFGLTRNTSAAHESASRNASPSRFRSRQAVPRAKGLV